MKLFKIRENHRFSVSKKFIKYSKIRKEFLGHQKLQSNFLVFSRKSQTRHIIILIILGLLAAAAMAYFIWQSGGLANSYLFKLFS